MAAKRSIFRHIDDLLSTEHANSSSTSKADDPQKFTCRVCQKHYHTYFGLRRHLQFHEEGKLEQKCPHCDKVYKSSGALKMHLKTHTLPFSCNDCGKSFSRPWLLKGHLRTHTGEKPFVCESCDRRFADRSNLRAHVQTHSAQRQYRCKTCSQSFTRMSIRLRHELGCTKNFQMIIDGGDSC